jgi:sugar phosphate isomerase/epimerase
MRLGVVGLIPSDFMTVDEALALHIRGLGFEGVGAHMTGDPLQASLAACQHLGAVLTAHDIRLVQFWGWYPSIVTDDEALRQTGVKAVQAVVRLGAKIGAEMVGVRPTSMSPSGPWSPDAANFAPATEDRLVNSLSEIAAVCASEGVPIALECHVVSTLSSPEAVRRIVERVGSPWVKVNLDPVNFVNDLPTAYRNTGLINRLFDQLGPSIAALHVKDVVVDDKHIVHISEALPGTGTLDFDTLFTRYEALLPGGFALIEHLPPDKVPAAAAFVRRKLQELKISFSPA